MNTVLVPCVEVGLGTGSAVIRDASGRRVRVEGVGSISLVGYAVHVRLEVVETNGDLVRVRHPGGELTWVRLPAGKTEEA